MPNYFRSESSLYRSTSSMPIRPHTKTTTARKTSFPTIHIVVGVQTNQSNMAAIMGPLLPGVSTLLAMLGPA